MIALKKVIAPVDDTPFDEICSFETENYVGAYVDDLPRIHEPGFVLMPKNGGEFSIEVFIIPESLEAIDNIVYSKTKEHIVSVSTSRSLKVEIDET